MNHYDLKDKVAIVTGARRGIGEGIASMFAANGAKVVVTDIDEKDCQRVVDKITKEGGKGLALELDVTNENDILKVVKKVVDEYGRIDILVNNAGIFIQEELDKMEVSAIDKILNVNLRGVLLCTKYVIPVMKQQNYGKIINTASIAGVVSFDFSSVYCATKGAIVNLTRELAMELSKYKINVNAVAPGVIETPMTENLRSDKGIADVLLSKIPYGRYGIPKDIANAAAFLVSDDSDYITGQTVVVDGGWTIY